MPKPTDKRLNAIVKHISRQIAEYQRALRYEECTPRLTADESDEYMKALKAQVSDLKGLRVEIESVFTRMVR